MADAVDSTERWCAQCSSTAHRMQSKWWCAMCAAFVKVVKPKKRKR